MEFAEWNLTLNKFLILFWAFIVSYRAALLKKKPYVYWHWEVLDVFGYSLNPLTTFQRHQF